MAIQWSNNASGALASSISSSATTIVLAAGQGVEFPTPGGGNYFYATLTDTSNNLEIVKVTARSVDTLTVLRGQDGTSARAYIAGDLLELRPTAIALREMQYNTPELLTANWTVNEQAGKLVFSYGGVPKFSMDGVGKFSAIGDISSNGLI
jgi:hypothetical protein